MLGQLSAEKTAIEHLRIIRTLMERAHIYRALSATAALFGGVLALIVSCLGFFRTEYVTSASLSGREFLASWMILLALSTILNLLLLMRESKGRGQAFVTDGLRMALRAVVPPLMVGGILGICLIIFKEEIALAALVWILCYGLALLSTANFAPKSVIRLGRAFVAGGIALTIIWSLNPGTILGQSSQAMASLFLGLTFGFFHIIYSVAVFLNTPKLAVTAPSILND